MLKRKKLLFYLAVLIIFAVFIHLTPVYNKTGQLDKGLGNLCLGYGGPVPHYYRIVPNGINGFSEDKNYFKYKNSELTCAEPVVLRLYLW